MELILGVLAVAVIVAGTVAMAKWLGLIRDFQGDADLKRRVLDLEVAAHDLKLYIEQRTPQFAPGGLDKPRRPPRIPGKDQEIDGHGDEVFSGPPGMGPGELGE